MPSRHRRPPSRRKNRRTETGARYETFRTTITVAAWIARLAYWAYLVAKHYHVLP